MRVEKAGYGRTRPQRAPIDADPPESASSTATKVQLAVGPVRRVERTFGARPDRRSVVRGL
jgi:hypothetical protein